MMNLANHFLVAMPDMDDPFFDGSVVYICEHNEDGALGLIINKPSPVTMDLIFAASDRTIPLRFQDDDGRAGTCRSRLCGAYADRQLAKQYGGYGRCRIDVFARYY